MSVCKTLRHGKERLSILTEPLPTYTLTKEPGGLPQLSLGTRHDQSNAGFANGLTLPRLKTTRFSSSRL